MKSDVYKINNAVEKIKMGKNTQFLDIRELKIVTGKLKKNEYSIYYPYKDSEKVMLYTWKIPKVKLFKIYTVENIRHQDILGSLYALNIDSSYFGDIVLYNDYYYVRAVALLVSIALWIVVAVEHQNFNAVIVAVMYFAYLVFDIGTNLMQKSTYENEYMQICEQYKEMENQNLVKQKLKAYKKSK